MAERRNKITFKFQGKVTEDGHVRLSEFVNRLESLYKLLHQIDLNITGEKSPTVYYQITNLSHDSPASIEIEAKPEPKYIDRSEAVIDKFYYGLDHMRISQQVPDGFPYEVLDAYKAFIEHPLKQLTSFDIVRDDEQLSITDDIVYTIDKAISGEFKNEGSMSGLLEAINIHGGRNKFTIYPLAGPHRVVCHFPGSQLVEAISAINRHVSVQGTFKYRSKAFHPFEVEVKEMEVFPDDDELPSLSSLRGIAPNATGDIDSVKFVRELRNGAEPT